MKDFHKSYSSVPVEEPHDFINASFQFHILLAVILFAVLLLFDKSNTQTAETAIENFSQAISADVEDKLEVWVNHNIKPSKE